MLWPPCHGARPWARLSRRLRRVTWQTSSRTRMMVAPNATAARCRIVATKTPIHCGAGIRNRSVAEAKVRAVAQAKVRTVAEARARTGVATKARGVAAIRARTLAVSPVAEAGRTMTPMKTAGASAKAGYALKAATVTN